jgi:hypothetical protein
MKTKMALIRVAGADRNLGQAELPIFDSTPDGISYQRNLHLAQWPPFLESGRCPLMRETKVLLIGMIPRAKSSWA